MGCNYIQIKQEDVSSANETLYTVVANIVADVTWDASAAFNIQSLRNIITNNLGDNFDNYEKEETLRVLCEDIAACYKADPSFKPSLETAIEGSLDFVDEILSNPNELYKLLGNDKNTPSTDSDPSLGSKELALDDPEAASNKRRHNFITDAYRTAVGALNRMEQVMWNGIIESLMFDNNTDSFVQSADIINENFRAFQEDLFERITEWLGVQGLYQLYTEDGNYNPIYTGDFERLLEDFKEELQAILDYILIKNDGIHMSVDKLNSLDSEYDDTSKSDSKTLLDAYNAFFILKHFDDLMHIALPQLKIKSRYWNSFELSSAGVPKYTFTTMGNTLESWQDLERDISAADLLNDLTKALIQNIDYYDWKQTTNYANKKLQLSDFNRIITRLKRLAFCDDALVQIDPASALGQKIREIYGRDFNNLFLIIGSINSNAPTNFRKLFMLLTSKEFWDMYALSQTGETDLNKVGLETQDLNIIWSLYKGIFELDPKYKVPSLYLRWRNDPRPDNRYNYFNFLVQACASIEAISLHQYAPRQGAITNRTLKDNVKNSLERLLERAMTYNFSPLRPINFKEEYSDKYRPETSVIDKLSDYLFMTEAIELTLTTETGQEQTKKELPKKRFHFLTGKDGFDVYVDPTDTDCKIRVIKDKKDYGKDTVFTMEDLNSIIPFLRDIMPALKITDIHSGFIKEYLRRHNNNYDLATRNLLNLGAYVFMNASLLQEIKSKNKRHSVGSFMAEVKSYYGNATTPNLNTSEPQGGFRSLIPTKLNLLIEGVAEAYNVVEGIYGDSIVRDSEGKMINLIGMSMLATKVEQQIATINLKDTSASKHFSLWKDGLYKGMQFTREFAGEGSTKAVSFNVNEHTLSQLLYDFLGGYCIGDNGKVLNDVGIMPSVLSDKSRILKVLLNMNRDSMFKDAKGNAKSYKELTAQEWKELASIELGTFYYNIWKNVTYSYDVLNTYLKKANITWGTLTSTGDTNIVELDYWNNFENFNELLKARKLKPDKVLHNLLLFYLKANPRGTLEITDLIHYVMSRESGVKKLRINPLIASEIYRFSDGENLTIINDKLGNKSRDFQRFAEWVGSDPTRNSAYIKAALAIYPEEAKTMTKEALATKYIIEHVSDIEADTIERLATAYRTNTGTSFYLSNYFTKVGNYLVIKLKEDTITISLNSIFCKLDDSGNPIANKWTLNIADHKYTSSKEFWETKLNDLIKGLLKNGCIIKTTDNAYNDLTTGESKKLQKLLVLLKHGVMNLDAIKPGDPNQQWYDFGSGWIALARVKCRRDVKNDKGKVEKQEFWLNITSEADARGLKYDIKDEKGNVIKTVQYGDPEFSFYDLKKYSDVYVDFEINPCIDTWNAVDFFAGQEYMNSTVGTHLNHPAKKKLNSKDLEEEAERWLAQVKRNVSISATKHSFALGLLNGIRSNYRIAVVEDDEVVTFNVYGSYDEGGAKPYDGVTFVCGANNYLENNSLAGAAAGTVKKQFVHSYKEETGTGIIIKTAGFALTNDNIRVSEFYARMNKKMMQGRWKTKNGEDLIIDITKNYFGDKIKYEPIYYYDEKTNLHYKVTKIESLGNNKYRFHKKVVNSDGTVTIDALPDERVITSNYDLWEAFGGAHAKELTYDEKSKTKMLVDSESSFRNLVVAMNSVSEEKFNKKDNIPESQEEVYLNLKYSNIDYIVTAGAIKQGAANINSKDAYFKEDYELTTMDISMHDSGIQLDAEHEADESTLSIMTLVVNALCARGYSLSPATEVYRAMLALTENGIKDQLEGLKLWLDVTDGSKETLQNAIADIILKGLKNLDKREGSLVEAVAENLIEEAKKGKRIKGKDLVGVIPFSHPAMFKLLTSMLSSAFTKSGIKIKFDGSLAVMNPSNGIWKIYGGRLLRDFEGDKTNNGLTREESLLEALKESDSHPLSLISDIRLGFHYKVTDITGKVLEEDLFIETPMDYWDFREKYEKLFYANTLRVSENVTVGRDLATYLANFEVVGENHNDSYNMWDLDVIKNLHGIKELQKILKDLYKQTSDKVDLQKAYLTSRDNIKASLKEEERAELKNSCELDRWIARYIPPVQRMYFTYRGEFNVYRLLGYLKSRWLTGVHENKLSIEGNVSINNLKRLSFIPKEPIKETQKEIFADLKTINTALRRELQSNLFAIGSGKETQVKIHGKLRQVAKGSTKVQAYELIMPKVYATKFGLRKGDTLHDITDKKEQFFLERAIEHWKTSVRDENLFDIELKHSNGEHIYILHKDDNSEDRFVQSNARNDILKKKLMRKLELKFDTDGNKIWRIDPSTEEKMYRLSSELDEVWLDEDGNEIIVTKNPQFFVETDHFSDIRLSKGANSTTVNEEGKLDDVVTEIDLHLDNLITILKNVDERTVKDYLAFIQPTGTELDRLNLILAINKYAEISMDLTIDKYNESVRIKDDLLGNRTVKALSTLQRKAKERYVSFLESLNILAARIPAQSMQSFMAMKVVGFDDAGVNNAYVNYWQIWLQGSDFDIDKVSLLGTSYTNDGQFVKWSPAFNISSERYMKASKTLPFPTGLTTVKLQSRIKGDLSVYNKIISDEYREIFEKQIWNLEPDEIIKFGEIVRDVISISEAMGTSLTIYYPADISPENTSILDKAINMINKHNEYLNTARDRKHMITNFITTYMINVSSDPANLILSQSSVDEMTAKVKDKAKDANANSYAPGNVESKMETLILTLTGKENVGIVASAMKTFEALSYFFNHRIENIGKYIEVILNSTGIKEDSNKILSQCRNIIIGQGTKGLEICGQYIKLLANTYVKNQEFLNRGEENGPILRVNRALNEIDNDEDAFLLISALLSLATDNAKDPILSKINASPEMIGLYTAGIAMGVNFDRLVDTVMSETGNYIASWISGNVFLGTEKRRIDQVIRYIEEGPELNGITGPAIGRLNSAIVAFRTENSKLYKSKDEIEAAKKSAEETYEKLTANADDKGLISSNKDTLRRRLMLILQDYGTKGIIEVFRTAIEIDNPNHAEVTKLLSEIRDANAELENSEDEALNIELHKKIMAAKDNLKGLKITSTLKRTRRILENLLLEYLDYGFKRSRINGEYKDAKGAVYKVFNPRSNKLRTNPWDCHGVGLAYVETIKNKDGSTIIMAHKVKTYVSGDIEAYKALHLKWKEQWIKLKTELWKDYLTALKSYETKLKNYTKNPTAFKKPERPTFKLGLYMKAFRLYREEQQFIEAEKARLKLEGLEFNPLEYQNKYPMPNTNFLEELYKDKDTVEKRAVEINNLLLSEPLPPLPLQIEFEEPVLVYKVFDSIKTLSEVNNEMGTLRDRLKLNLGLPNAFGEQLAALRSFKNILINRIQDKKLTLKSKDEIAKNLDGSLELDLHKFVSNKDGYRDRAIAEYEKLKKAFNVLDAVWEVPHYRGYLEDFDVLINSGKAMMLGYRATEKIGDKVADAFGYRGGDKLINIYNLTNKFVMNVINNNFLRTKQLVITIPPGLRFFTEQGDMKTASTLTQVVLGTAHGNASFKLWFEDYVLPNMKKGFFGKYREVNGLITSLKEDNHFVPRFIKDLQAVEIDKTVTGNAAVNYSLPVSMLPRSESEWALYRRYKDELNRLNVTFYQQGINPRTGEIVQTALPFKNLLFIYNLIAYGGENNLNAFTSMFEDMLRDESLPIQLEYVKFLSEFDANSDFVEGKDYSLLDIIQWCAPIVGDPRSPGLPEYIRYYDENQMRYVLLHKNLKNVASGDSTAEPEPPVPADEHTVTTVIGQSDYSIVTNNKLINKIVYNNSLFFIRDITNFRLSDILRVDGRISVKLKNKSEIEELKYQGTVYTPELLIKRYKDWIDLLEALEKAEAAALKRKSTFNRKKYEARMPKLEDFNILMETIANGNVNEVIPSRTLIKALVDEIFNPCA